MKRKRRMPFFLFVVCLAAAMPLSWGASDRKGFELTEAVHPAVNYCRVPPRQLLDGPPSPVTKTGQTGCWRGESPWDQISCTGTGQDGEYRKGVSVDPRFTDNLDGTVSDNLTGLIWLKDADCFGLQTWTNALSNANTLASGACELSDGSVAGDWRLPNVKELQSLIDFSQFYPALPPGHPFSEVQPTFYWSSSAYAFNPRGAWVVNLPIGLVFFFWKTDTYSVWPVRGGQ